MMNDAMSLSCPVCKASFRGQTQCPRCGSDLSRLMWIAGRAAQLRRLARDALRQGHYHQARDLSQQALDLHATPTGRRLLMVSRIMNTVHVDTLS